MGTNKKPFISYILIIILIFSFGCAESKEKQIEKLLNAAKIGDNKKIKELLARGFDVNSKKYPKGFTALHYAVGGAHVDTVKLLLASGASFEESGTADGGKSGGAVILARPLILAEIILESYKRWTGDSNYKFDDPDTIILAKDDDAINRYKTILSLLKNKEENVKAVSDRFIEELTQKTQQIEQKLTEAQKKELLAEFEL